MIHVDFDAAVVVGGITGHVGIWPPAREDIPAPPTDESLWFTIPGWPDWTGTWVEPWQVQGATEDGGRGD